MVSASPRLPPVRALALCSAAWQFNVVPDRGRITRLELRAGRKRFTPAVVSARNADALSLTSRRLLWPGWLTSPGPASADGWQKSKGN
jgi:hypothetical protein